MSSGSVNPSRHCNVLCGRKKLPFAGYSIVKDRSGLRPEPHAVARSANGLAPLPRAARSRSLPRLASLARRVDGSLRSARLKHSGEYRARTGDLLVANQALSQLS